MAKLTVHFGLDGLLKFILKLYWLIQPIDIATRVTMMTIKAKFSKETAREASK